MSKKKLLIKQESVLPFFLEHCTQINEKDIAGSFSGQPNPYYFFKDLIYIKKDSVIYENVVFELEDRTNHSGRDLTNVYTYDLQPYDDYSDVLFLIKFEIVVPEYKIDMPVN